MLCPKRHCIVASAQESPPEVMAHASLEVGLQRSYADQVFWRDLDSGFTDQPTERWKKLGLGRINPRCGICGAPRAQWRIEIAWTHWATLKEAEPHLRRCEFDQLLTRLMIDEQKAKAIQN